MNQAAWTVGLLLSTCITGFHVCGIYVAVTSKELREVRFLRLALFLSIGDCVMGIEFMYMFLLKLLNTSNNENQFQCMLMLHVISGTVMSSLLQTLLICLERFNATFSIKRRFLDIMTGNIAVVSCFAIPHCFAFMRFAIDVSNGLAIAPCDYQYTIHWMFLFSHDIPAAVLLLSIAGVYAVVIIRIVKQQRAIGFQTGSLTATQMEKKKTAALRTRKNIVTLGIIIAVAALSVFPRSVLAFYANTVDDIEHVEAVAPFVKVTNSAFILLNPFFDPIIYFFRIKKYREQLICKCCLRSNASANT